MSTWFTIVIAVVAGALGAVIYQRYAVPTPQRFVVVDVQRMLEPLAADRTIDDTERRVRAKLIAEAVRRSADRFAESGFIVLDASAVLKAPKDVYVEP